MKIFKFFTRPVKPYSKFARQTAWLCSGWLILVQISKTGHIKNDAVSSLG